MNTEIILIQLGIVLILTISLIIKSNKKYYIGQIVFKRTKSDGIARLYYFFDVASNGSGEWKIYSIEVGEGAYNKFNINDEILILI